MAFFFISFFFAPEGFQWFFAPESGNAQIRAPCSERWAVYLFVLFSAGVVHFLFGVALGSVPRDPNHFGL
jgi:hypothetical protein